MANLSQTVNSATTPRGNAEDLVFPAQFLWGVSTSAHQVEGNAHNNQWCAWESAGRIKSGDSCGSACDWWKNAERDFDLARDLGLNALRLSVEWSRIEPRPGEWDESALERYRAMLSALLDRGIRPFVTLHHFTHPLWFEHAGGFLSPHSADLFERFAARVVAAMGDLCNDWVTINEPNVYCAMAYALGEFPPGQVGEIGAALRALGAMARAHARAYRVIHRFRPDANVGWAQNYLVFQPAGAGIDRMITWLQHKLFNDSFARMVSHGRVGFPLKRWVGDVSEVRETCDFIGLNVYSRFHVCFDRENPRQFYGRMFVPPHLPQGDHGVEMPYGEAYPQVITAAVESVRRANKPIYILENGVPDASDRIRPWLLVNSLKETHQAIAGGADIRGYFHWSLTDNFEWSEGWGLRFGLFALNEKTQERTIRPSGKLYSQIVNGNALPQELVERYAEVPQGSTQSPVPGA
jgi:beta-glucosidase